MINLYQEINTALASNGKTFEDILWVGTKEFYIPTEAFLAKAQEVYYDQERGCPEVGIDLLIIGADWGLRRKYDAKGAEEWEFIIMPEKPAAVRADALNLTIRDVLDPMGFRVHNDACTMLELNPES